MTTAYSAHVEMEEETRRAHARALFDELAADYTGSPGVSLGKVFHSEGLTVGGKVFALQVRGQLVVKISAAQAAALVEAGVAAPFEPRPGRQMKEWVVMPWRGDTGERERWRALMADAHTYIASLAAPSNGPPDPKAKAKSVHRKS